MVDGFCTCTCYTILATHYIYYMCACGMLVCDANKDLPTGTSAGHRTATHLSARSGWGRSMAGSVLDGPEEVASRNW